MRWRSIVTLQTNGKPSKKRCQQLRLVWVAVNSLYNALAIKKPQRLSLWGFFYVQDVLYAAVAWMPKSGDAIKASV